MLLDLLAHSATSSFQWLWFMIWQYSFLIDGAEGTFSRGHSGPSFFTGQEALVGVSTKQHVWITVASTTDHLAHLSPGETESVLQMQ